MTETEYMKGKVSDMIINDGRMNVDKSVSTKKEQDLWKELFPFQSDN